MNKLLIGIAAVAGLIIGTNRKKTPICSSQMEDIYRQAGEELRKTHPDGKYSDDEYWNTVKKLIAEAQKPINVSEMIHRKKQTDKNS